MTGSLYLRARNLVSELGIRNAIAYRLDNFLYRMRIGRFVSYGIFAQPVKDGISSDRPPQPRPGPVEYRIIDGADPMMLELELGDALQFRIEQGATCVGAVKEGRMIGAIWFVEGSYQEDEVRCWFFPEPKGAAVWDFGVYVDPEYRLSPIFSRLWMTSNRIIAGRGAKWTCSRISAYNPGSIRSHIRMGAVCVGKVRFLNLFGLQIMWGDISPFFHVSLPSDSGPALHVGPVVD